MAGAEHSGYAPRHRYHRRTLLRRSVGYDALAQKGHRFPAHGAVAFGTSTLLRNRDLVEMHDPLLAAAVTVGSAFFFFLLIVGFGSGQSALKCERRGAAWLFAAALVNTGAILSFFFAPNLGKVVRMESLVACNPLLTILWSVLFFRGLEQLATRDIVGAVMIITGRVLVVTAK